MGRRTKKGFKMKELIIRKCDKCNALIKVIEDCKNKTCKMMCCGEEMKEVKANSTDASKEKHLPVYEKVGNDIKITVPHVMDEDHYIEWILVKTKNKNIETIFAPQEKAEMTVPYEKGALIYSYCNKHGLWKSEVK